MTSFRIGFRVTSLQIYSKVYVFYCILSYLDIELFRISSYITVFYCFISNIFLCYNYLIHLFNIQFYFYMSICCTIMSPIFFRKLPNSTYNFLYFSSFTVPPCFFFSSWFIFWTINSWISFAFVSYSLGTLLIYNLGIWLLLCSSSSKSS